MKTISRCLRVWVACFTQAIRRDLQFRAQTLSTALTAVLDVALSALPVWLMVRTDTTAGSWTTGTELVGLFNIAAALLDTFISPNLERFSTMVRTGQLDLLLIRPIPAPWLSMTRWMRPASLTRAVTGGVLLAVATAHDPQVVPPDRLLLAVAWTTIGLVAWALMCANLAWLAFWFTGTDPVITIAGSLREAGQYPLAYFTHGPRRLFTTLAPSLLLAAIPLSAARHDPTPSLLAGVLGVGAGLIITRVHWHFANQHYESASS